MHVILLSVAFEASEYGSASHAAVGEGKVFQRWIVLTLPAMHGRALNMQANRDVGTGSSRRDEETTCLRVVQNAIHLKTKRSRYRRSRETGTEQVTPPSSCWNAVLASSSHRFIFFLSSRLSQLSLCPAHPMSIPSPSVAFHGAVHGVSMARARWSVGGCGQGHCQ